MRDPRRTGPEVFRNQRRDVQGPGSAERLRQDLGNENQGRRRDARGQGRAIHRKRHQAEIRMSLLQIIAVTSLCVSGLGLLTGCETTTQGGAVGGERKQLLLVSSQELDQMAAQGYAKLKSEAAAKGTL